MGAGTEASGERLYSCGSPTGSDEFDEGPADYAPTNKDPPGRRITAESVAGKGMLVVDGNLQRTGIRFKSQLLCRLKPIALVWIVVALGVVGVLVPFSSLLPRASGPDVTTSTNSLPGVDGHTRSHHLLSPLGWTFRSRKARPGPPHQLPSVEARCAPPDPTHQHLFLFGKPFDLAAINTTSVTRERGIVIAASGLERMAVGAYVTSYVARRVLGSKLPIEIYYVGEKEALPEATVVKLKELGDVEVIDLAKALEERYGGQYRDRGASTGGKLAYLSPSEEQLRSYAAKPYAVLASSFRENLLFDAGAVPFQQPETFFDLETYRASGFTVFRDYVPSFKDRWAWLEKEACVDVNEMLSYLDGTEADSSCVLIDKKENWDALVTVVILNGPMQSVTYKRLNGDKDTWVLGMFYTQHHLKPLSTTPGFLFIDYLGDSWGRKVHGQLQLIKVGGGVASHSERPEEQPGLIPLYHNNQLFNFTDWDYNRDWVFVGSYEDFGSLYNPPDSLTPDCSPYDVAVLDPLNPQMIRAFDGVTEALKELGSNHCACRDDWPSQCVWWIW